MRVLAVDPGEKRIGIAISDPTGMIASPLTILMHISRLLDAAAVANLAAEHQVDLIVVGKSLDDDGKFTPQSRRADRFAHTLQQQCSLPVVLWDESFSTQEARQARIAMGTTRKERRGHMDDLAAAIILQSYLEAQAGQ